ncbi:retropepsin-like aspartic protease family protein [Aureimonas populi]|uniref:TIGR02281 family clan AA aspartic protease n=1 Tax=Aureimonas populi TaxID=1701758 RepID=A0ABW5CKR8_9HYPH|nr:TIGR02281 family clan AA aspartic protease [Aureimonas populi]
MRNSSLLFVLLAVLFGGLALLLMSDGTVAGLEDRQFAGLVQLSAVGLFIGSGVLILARSGLSRALRNALIWGAIFLALIAAYAYESEFRGFAGRIQAVLVPGRAVSLGGQEGQVLAVRGRDDHFRLDAQVNGRRVPFLVDTGASVVAIDRGTAEAVGLDLSALAYTAQIRTANGIARAAPVTLDEVRVGDIARRNVVAVVTEGDGIGIDLLGMSFLGSLSSVDFRGDRLVLTD